MRDYTIYCGGADEKKAGGCAVAVRNDCNNLVEELGSTPSRCAFVRLRGRRGRKLWIASVHVSAETAEQNSNDAFYHEFNALMSKIPSQQVVIVEIDANAKMGLEQQSDLLGKWHYPAKRTSDNGTESIHLSLFYILRNLTSRLKCLFAPEILKSSFTTSVQNFRFRPVGLFHLNLTHSYHYY
ncbi:hypothetical protein RB195_022229 [Necator americanus]|uniref:Uncharacterized protein n=1 Tax=Necator americanus TaxID=51031 RepID=A0ABR1EH44_NECAM